MVAKTLWLVYGASLVLVTSCVSLTPQEKSLADIGLVGEPELTVTEQQRLSTVISAKPNRDAPEPQVAATANEARAAAMPALDLSGEQAIIQLRSQALELQSQGKWQQAGLVLERALRIDARKADLYQQLATVRLGEQRFSEAEQIALKGLTMGSDSPQLSANLWQIIGQCRSAEGDISGAQQARTEMELWLNRR